MKQILLKISPYCLIIITCCFWQNVFSQELVALESTSSDQATAQKQQESLMESLDRLTSEYKVQFAYNDKVIENKVVSKSLAALENSKGSFDEILMKLLHPLGLNYEQLQEHYYVIYPDEKKVFKSSGGNFKIMESGIIKRLSYQNLLNTTKLAQVITGRVTDQESGEPLPGVSILLKGTSTGTVTDIDGRFRINLVNKNAILIFSFIGYSTQEVQVNDRHEINVAMVADVQSLEEVVVVGYGTQKKSVITGAISSIKASDMENQQIGRIEQALQGRTSGLTIASSSGAPGAESTIRIRGATSLNSGASNPLYVVDGVVVDIGSIDYLNPSDIESIEVLKDAASAAIYGARSSAGVILVTTKKGKSGSIRVNYNGYFGTQAPAKKLDLLNATQYAEMRNEQAENAGEAIVYPDPASLGEGTDWQSLIFNNKATIQNHEVSLSGGSEKSSFYTSFGYFDQEGIVATDISNYKRHNIRINSTHKVADRITVGQTLGYSHIKNKGGVAGNTDFGGPLSGAIMLDPITKPVITDPDIINQVPYSSQPVVRNADGNPYGISETVQQQVTNPLAYIQTRKGNYSWSDNIVGNVFVEAEPVPGLKLRSSLGARLNYWGSENFTPLFYLNSNQQSTQTSFTRNQQKSLNWNLENTISYSRNLEDHNFTILLGQGAYLNNNRSGMSVTYFNLPVNNFEDASMNYDVAADDITASGSEGIHHTVSSLFSRLTYNFKEKYLFTGIIRRDGSSRFGANNKYGYFPSASVGWVATQESFWPEEEVVDFFKLRGSYGITGNDVLGNFRYLSTVGGGRNYIFGDDNYYIGYSPDAPANPDLRWEETSQLNFGLDAVLFQDWTLTLDWYKKKTAGILQTIVLPNYMGATGSPYGNVADMENRGVELEIGYRKRLGEVNFDLKGNISYLENEVTYLGEDKEFLEDGANIQNSSYRITRTVVGHAINSFYGFKTNGIFQNQDEVDAYIGPEGTLIQPDAVPGDFRWTDINNDGVITEDDRTFIGDPTPDWSYGVTFTAKWKNFDLLLFGQGVSGNMIFQGLRRLDIPTANWQNDVLSRWHGEGTSNTYPRLTTSDDNKNFAHPSDFHLERGDYFRIKTLQIGYSLPKSIIGKAAMQRARIYISSNNLLTITKYTGFDPEIGGSSYSIDRAIYPQSRSFLFGVNVSF
jgi:TonB-linked SusC/RagA family outer membrane protein